MSSTQTDNTDADDMSYIDPVKKYSTIGNLEDMKRLFFNCPSESDELGKYVKNYSQFIEYVKKELETKPYQFLKVTFKDSSEMNGKQDYIARNLNCSFVKEFEDYKKYLFCCFRCIQPNRQVTKYEYVSYWIVNTPDIKHVIDQYDDQTKKFTCNRYDDFNWELYSDVSLFLNDFLPQQKEDIESVYTVEYLDEDDYDPFNLNNDDKTNDSGQTNVVETTNTVDTKNDIVAEPIVDMSTDALVVGEEYLH